MNYGTVSYKDGLFHVKTQPHVVLRLKRTFGRVSKKRFDVITLGDTTDVARDLEWFLQRYPMTFEGDAEKRLTERANSHRERETLVARLLANVGELRDFEMAEPPRDYQRQAAELAIARGSLLLVDDMGLGKTITSICVLTQACARPALCVVPKAVQRQWQRQINRFAPQLKTHILKQGTPYDFMRRGKHKLQMPLPFGDALPNAFPDVLICTYAKLGGWAETLAPVLKGLVLDEVQELRNGTATTKGSAASHLAAHTNVRLGLSGTPIYNYGGELFNVVDVISPGALGEQTEFSNEWCDGGVERVKDPKALGSFLRAEGIMLRRTRTDVGRELPAFERVFHLIDSDREPIEEIEAAAQELAHRVLVAKETQKGDRMRASEELSVLVRQATGVAKAPHVADFVRLIVESGESVVLFGWHRKAYEIWNERLAAYNPVMVTGSETDKQKDDALQAFVAGKSNVIIISLRSAAGLDGLQFASRTVVHGEFDYSPGVHEQADTRVYRDGQESPVIAYYLESEEGSDPIVSSILQKKGEQLTGVRDPDAELFEKLQTSGDHVKRLAERYIKQVAAE